jgi:hypothetical protein
VVDLFARSNKEQKTKEKQARIGRLSSRITVPDANQQTANLFSLIGKCTLVRWVVFQKSYVGLLTSLCVRSILSAQSSSSHALSINAKCSACFRRKASSGMPNIESSIMVCIREGKVRIACESMSSDYLPFELEKRETGVLLHHDFPAPEKVKVK